jgi:hypothetical protein
MFKIYISSRTILNTLLFADDHVLSLDSEDGLHRPLYTLHNTTKQVGLQISPLKSRVMVFKGLVTIRSKTVTDNII